MSDAEPTAPDDAYSQLLAAYDDALAAGVRASSLNHPVAPEELRSRLESQAAWCGFVRRMLGPADSTVAPGPAAGVGPGPWLDPSGTGRFGRFHIRRELGHGSFGIVFLAHDSMLDREVALKVPRPEVLLTPELRARFQQEARVAAGLEHPNIVAVYEAGVEGAVCYIASAYCPGITLAAWLKAAAEPVPFRLAAELTAALAHGVAHAHARGVLHRDLKPTNVLLQMVDCGLQIADLPSTICNLQSTIPKIADFGLAKLLDSQGIDAQTRTGAILGTPNYMAPEQAAGHSKEIGPATDIYALGAILYEMLTRRPPFVGDSTLETLQLVRDHEPLMPARLRPNMPRDLETICLKCLQKEPAKRYASAQTLADDLGRFLNAQPILARPTPGWERLVKWTKRRPALAALGAVSTAALVAVVAVVLVYNVRLQRQRDATEGRRREAVASLLKAREAADLLLTRVSEEKLLDVPNMVPLRRQLLEDALRVYSDLALQAGDDPDMRYETARAHKRLAIMRDRLGQADKAEESFRSGIAILEQLVADFPAAPAYWQELAKGLQNLALFIFDKQRSQRWAEVEALFRRAIAIEEQLAKADPAEPSYRADLAWIYTNFGVACETPERRPQRAQAFHKANDLLSEVVAQQPAVSDYVEKLIQVRNNLTEVLENREEEERIDRENIESLQGLIARNPRHMNYRSKLAIACTNLGGLLARTGRPSEGKQFLRRAVDLRQQLLEEAVREPHPHDALASALRELADHCAREGAYDEARRHLERVVAERRAAAKLDPSYSQHLRSLLDDCSALGDCLIQLRDHAAAARAAEGLAAVFPQGAHEHVRAAILLARCIPAAEKDRALPEAQRQEAARRYADKAVQQLGDAVRLGLPDLDALRKDPALATLRSRDDFQKLLRQQPTR
jgi:tetratricopeptide (TPR) repeat protein